MMRSIPTTLTALQLALAAAAAWLLYETNALQGAALMMFHLFRAEYLPARQVR